MEICLGLKVPGAAAHIQQYILSAENIHDTTKSQKVLQNVEYCTRSCDVQHKKGTE